MDLNKVLQETVTLIEHQLATARIEVNLCLDEKLPRIKGNPGKLQQVFLNLFLNARDAMESGGVLAVKSSASDGLVRVTVADTGSGIAPEHLARVFDPFFTTKAARRGTGLGLSVSYGIVKEHSGEIEVESQTGAGTRFHVIFPELAAPRRAPVPQHPGPANCPLLPRMRFDQRDRGGRRPGFRAERHRRFG